MDTNFKEELENRVKNIESLIEERGIGASRLTKARKIQRNVNVAVFLGSLFTVAGIAAWLLNSDKD
mgnify:CR=1 FL=1